MHVLLYTEFYREVKVIAWFMADSFSAEIKAFDLEVRHYKHLF